MALVPVEIFQQPGGLLGQIASGNNTIAQALQNMFNVGRDLANNQVRQERDFAAEVGRLDALDQRRAENTQQQANLDRRYARDVFEGDRQFEAMADERAIDNARADETLEFNRKDADRRFDIFAKDQAFEDKERERVAAERAKTEGFNAKVGGARIDPFADEGEQVAIAKAKRDAAKAAGDSDAFLAAEAELGRLTGGKEDKEITESQRIARERFDYTKQQDAKQEEARQADAAAKSAEKAAKEAETEAAELLSDTDAFVPHSVAMAKEVEADGKTPKDPVKAAKAEARDADRFGAERSAARNAGSRAAFIALGGDDLTKEQKAKRGRFYDLTTKKTTGGYGDRPDGTAKGSGWLGELKLPDGGVATEYTMQSDAVKVDGNRIDFPTLVPTLTPQEVELMRKDIIPNKKPIPEPIIQKAIAYAKQRLAEGKSVYADPSPAARSSVPDANSWLDQN